MVPERKKEVGTLEAFYLLPKTTLLKGINSSLTGKDIPMSASTLQLRRKSRTEETGCLMWSSSPGAC